MASKYSEIAEIITNMVRRRLQESSAPNVLEELRSGGMLDLEVLVRELKATPTVDLAKRRFGNLKLLLLGRALQEGAYFQLRELRLGGNMAGDEEVQLFVNAILSFSWPSLQVLNLKDNEIGEVGVSEIARALRSGKLHSLHTLDLRRNPIGLKGVAALASGLESGQVPGLRRLLLGDSSIGEETRRGSPLSAMAELGKALQSESMSHLKMLGLYGFALEDPGELAILRAALQANRVLALEDLHFVRTSIGDSFSSFFDESIQPSAFRSMLALRVAYNNVDIGDTGVEAFAKYVESGQMALLQVLDLRKTLIGKQSLLRIAALLEAGQLPSLQHVYLCLSRRQIKEESTFSIAEAFLGAYFNNSRLVAKIVFFTSINLPDHLVWIDYFRQLNMYSFGIPQLTFGRCTYAEVLSSTSDIFRAHMLSRELRFDRNISDDELSELALASLLREFQRRPFPHLRELRFPSIRIGDVGLSNIADGIRMGNLPSLEILHFKGVPPGKFQRLSFLHARKSSGGILALATALECGPRPTLKHLVLDQRSGPFRINEKSAEALGRALESGKVELVGFPGEIFVHPNFIHCAPEDKPQNGH